MIGQINTVSLLMKSIIHSLLYLISINVELEQTPRLREEGPK